MSNSHVRLLRADLIQFSIFSGDVPGAEQNSFTVQLLTIVELMIQEYSEMWLIPVKS